MSRVRIYELAKEAGMASKQLADMLIEQGFDIKGHSSTVDDETAEKIRLTVLKKTSAKLVEKRIDADTGPTVIRRRSTVIRRKAAPEPEPEPEVDVVAEEPEVVVGESEKTPSVESPVETPVSEPARESAEPVVQVTEPVDSAQVAEEAKDAGGTAPTAPPAVDLEEPVASESEKPVQKESFVDVTAEEAVTAVEPETEAAPLPPVRKGMARVVGTIQIELPKDNIPAPRTKKKPSRPAPVVPKQGAGPAPAAEPARGKKKGRRGDGPGDDDNNRKGHKKGRRNVQVTRFGDDYGYSQRRGKKGRGRAEKKPVQPAAEMKAIKKRIKVYETITVADLAHRMGIKSNEVIAKLMGLGVMATLNQAMDVDTATLIASEFGYEVEQARTEEIGVQQLDELEAGGEAVPRPPVVTVMGHVDHGKTSVLDAIRKTDVAAGEAGGITQHIGAYHVTSKAGDVTFVDTPGHAAFTEMRARGAQITDLVVLVVAADDGVMDQTREAIRHSQAADVPILVVVNKIDKENADPERVKRELAELDLAPEEWGGQTIYCETSAKNNVGIDNLLDNIQLMAEMFELKADVKRKARGRVVEAKLDKGRGSVATVLVQEGTLVTGDYFVVGQYSGKVRAMLNDKNKPIKKAGPSIPVEVQGLTGVPQAGDEFIVVTDEKMAKSVSQARTFKVREKELAAGSKVSLDKLFEQMAEGAVQELRVILRSDVQGTLEAFGKSAEQLSTDAVKVRVLHEGTGTITESDILLASASDAIIIGFNVRPTAKVKELAAQENVDIRFYDVIYHALDDIRKAMVGLLEPTFEEEVIGNAEVRETFHVPKIGNIGGCFVTSGKILRKASVRVVRDGVVVYTGRIGSLRRFKDDAKEVLAGYECGIGVENYNDIKIGDNFEAFIVNEVAATLED
ncbi:MAG: translation initiation factor IF-2 [Desulfobulbaceae bacterium]|uniref:Translation initiation factor IF-2 n=1 Tax=Candidatus Desulfatifera sulfidica TaxID=2841691 RepID=A0A8J6TDU0_9BACT|nr:translation initiation factor IF-2 [Candidatus Desulfatifera sulfidica]